MSTRSVIAIPVGDSWKGRYHHSDGYPSGVGCTLFNLVRERGLEWTRKTLTKDHSGWSSINSADFDLPPGFSNKPYGKDAAGNFARLDFRPHCYCHGDRKERGWWITREGDDSGTEWAYVLGALALVIEKRVGYNEATLRWETVASIPWTAAEPNWKEVGRLAVEEVEAK